MKVRIVGQDYEVLKDALVDGVLWLILFDPSAGGLGRWVRRSDVELVWR